MRLHVPCLLLLLASPTYLWTQSPDSREELVRTARSLKARDISALREEAKAGNPRSQFLLGTAYDLGFGVQKDAIEAVKWYRVAAEQGVAFAQTELGLAYLFGRGGLSKDKLEASKWFLRAAEQGDPMAQQNLGSMYLNGDGREAEKWYRKAAAGGLLEAARQLCGMYGLGNVGIPKDESEARSYCRKEDSDGRCRLKVQSKDDRVFSLDGEGFEPDEELRVISVSDGEKMQFQKTASSKGTFGMSMWPQVRNEKDGTASFTILGKGCKVSVIYNWRSF